MLGTTGAIHTSSESQRQAGLLQRTWNTYKHPIASQQYLSEQIKKKVEQLGDICMQAVPSRCYDYSFTDNHSIFTSISIPVVLQVINSKISTYPSFTTIYKVPTEQFIKLLEFTTTSCIFFFNKKFYKQLQGAAMTSPAPLSLQISTWKTLNT